MAEIGEPDHTVRRERVPVPDMVPLTEPVAPLAVPEAEPIESPDRKDAPVVEPSPEVLPESVPLAEPVGV